MTKRIENNNDHTITSRAYLCSENCRSQWEANLPADFSLEKPRLFFERLCGMCGKELANISKNQIFAWETREFCNKLCLGKRKLILFHIKV